MSEQNWTKEPWNCDGVFLWVEGVETATGTHPDGTPYPFPVQVQQQIAQFSNPGDAQRAESCVTAMQGIPSPSYFVARALAMEEALKTIDTMPVDGCTPMVIESMLRQAKSLAYTALAQSAVEGGGSNGNT